MVGEAWLPQRAGTAYPRLDITRITSELNGVWVMYRLLQTTQPLLMQCKCRLCLYRATGGELRTLYCVPRSFP